MYGLIIYIRNLLYDWGVFRSQAVPVRTIGVGNLAVGGTGKTPHTISIVEHLKITQKVAVLSRGYKRKTKGFVLANAHSTANEIGDEPMLIHSTFPEVPLAVCENRVAGVRQLLQAHPDLDVVILDDVFQHRKIKIDDSIVLTAYDRLYVNDRMLPWGRLRDCKRSIRRAQAVVVTKCPESLSEEQMQAVRGKLNLNSQQTLHFSTVKYAPLRSVFPENKNEIKIADLKDGSILMLTGIANPKYMHDYLSKYCNNIQPTVFSDHHDFTRKDMEHIQSQFSAMSADGIILTTEKDAMRLLVHPNFPSELKAKTYALPIRVAFLSGEADFFGCIC